MPFLIEMKVEPKTATDHAALVTALRALEAEDATLRVEINAESREIILKGQSELQLDMAIDVLRRQRGIALEVGAPQVAYREVLKKPVSVNYTHTPQSARGYASTVSTQGAVLFRERIEEAVEALRDAAKFAKQDPEWFAVAVDLAVDQGWSAEVVEELCEGSAQVDPMFIRTMIDATRYYYPQWHGKPGELEKFATFSVKLTEKQWGKAVYARIATQAQTAFGYRVFQEFGFSWATAKQGFEDWNRRYPPDLDRTETFCRLACDARDRETAAKLFAVIGSRGSPTI